MRKMFLGVVLVILSVQFLHAQNKDSLMAPPGTVKIRDNFFVDQTETLNIHWLEYLHYQGRDLDSASLDDLIPYYKDETYFNNPYYRFYSLHNVNYQQVVKYCKWRSEIVSNKIKGKIVYRLPTPAEWNQIAAYVLKGYSDRKQKKSNKIKKNSSSIFQTKNDNKISNLFENVSEMTSIEGIAKGGNYKKKIRYIDNIKQIENYKDYSNMVGFRCVAEYVE